MTPSPYTRSAMKRSFDVLLASFALVVTSPLLIIGAIGIRLSSPGPVVFRASRYGFGRRRFTMYKLRTMHTDQRHFASSITAIRDPRVFWFGGLLRKLKIDELPQLINIIKGEMSIVGPRSEMPNIVEQHYTPLQMQTMDALPGLVAPGTIYAYAHEEDFLDSDDAERAYVERLLPMKLALDLVYVFRASFAYDLRLILRTVWVIAGRLAGRRTFPPPPELEDARQWCEPARMCADAPMQ